jgi:hypothetical protein
VDRFARAVVAGKYRTLYAAVGKCHAALARIGTDHVRSIPAVDVKLARRSRALGRVVRAPRWTPDEKRLADRFARAIIALRYSSVEAAIPDFRRALVRAGLPDRHSNKGIHRYVEDRTQALGRHVWQRRKPEVPLLTRGEQRVIDRFARRVASGRIAFARRAVPPCRRELAQLAPPSRLPDWSICRHLISRAHDFGRPAWKHPWTEPELRLVLRYAHALEQGKYRSTSDAARACRGAMRKAGLQLFHSLDVVSDKLRELTPGRTKKAARWASSEDRILARFARAIYEGRYAGVPAALPACAEALEKLTADAHPARPRRTLEAVSGRLRRAVSRLGPGPRRRWSESENRAIERYAQAVMRKRFWNVLTAARACWAAVNRLGARGGAPDPAGRARRVTRTLTAVLDRLSERTWQLGRPRRSQRRWSKEERRISARWARRLGLHKQGRLRMSCLTMAGIMQGELGRRGYRRTRTACATETLKRYRSGIT